MNDIVPRNRMILGAIAGILTLGLVLAFFPWRASGGWRDAAVRRLSVSLAAPDLTAESAQFTLLPSPQLKLAKVRFSQSSGSISGTSEEAIVHLSALDLLVGRAKPEGLTLSAPDLRVRLDGHGEKGFRRGIDTASQLAGAVLVGHASAPLPRININDGRIVVSRADEADVLAFDNARLRLSLPGLGDPVSLSFRARQGKQETKLSFSGATPARMLSRTREPVRFSYSGQGISVDFDGDGVLSSAPALTGRITASSTGAALASYGLTLSEQPAARISLTSLLDYSARGANLSEVILTVGPDKFDGAGSLRHDGQRWHVSGTLATGRADLTALVRPFDDIRKPDGTWNSTAFEIDRLFAHSIDLRLSADQFTVFGRKLEKVALSVLTRPNKAEISIGEATWHKGAAKFRVSATPGSFGLDVKLSGTVDKVDISSALADFTREQRMSGQGNATIALETSGRSFSQFIANAEGRLAAMIRGGEIHGIDLNRLASRRGARGDLALTEALGGRTPFETASLSARISNGSAQPVEGHMRAGRLVGTMQGAIDFGRATHDLTGWIVQTPADAQASEPLPVLEFTVGGPLTEPQILPNIAAIFRRS